MKMQIVGDPVQRTETKRKTRTVEAGGYAEVEQHEFEDRKKPKQLTKEEKIAQIFDICGVAIPSEGKTKNFGDGTFVSGSAGYIKEQYNIYVYKQGSIGCSFLNGGWDECGRFFESGCTEDLSSTERFLGVVWRRTLA